MERYRATLVLGLGVSGEWAARLLRGEGCDVLALDERDDNRTRATARALRAHGIRTRLGRHALPDQPFDVCIASPGVPCTGALTAAVRKANIPVQPEIELGWSRCACKTLAITGTNGKSTLARLCADALIRAGYRAVACGNIGLPVSRVACERPLPEWLVIECSSFQLETIRSFRPEVTVLLNVFPDHLDRHGKLAGYANIKWELITHTAPGGTALVWDEFERAGREFPAHAVLKTFGGRPDSDYRYAAGVVTRRGSDPIEVDSAQADRQAAFSFQDTLFANDVFGLTAAAAVGATEACGVEPRAVVGAASVFIGLPHRMELVGQAAGVRFVDDSKSTNMAGLVAALRMTPGPVHLIAGGRLKERDLGAAKKELAGGRVSVYLIGEAATGLASAWSGAVDCCQCGSLQAAVEAAWVVARAGDTVLLAPGCASFDQFSGFEERGDRFKEIVHRMSKEGTHEG